MVFWGGSLAPKYDLRSRAPSLSQDCFQQILMIYRASGIGWFYRDATIPHPMRITEVHKDVFTLGLRIKPFLIIPFHSCPPFPLTRGQCALLALRDITYTGENLGFVEYSPMKFLMIWPTWKYPINLNITWINFFPRQSFLDLVFILDKKVSCNFLCQWFSSDNCYENEETQ